MNGPANAAAAAMPPLGGTAGAANGDPTPPPRGRSIDLDGLLETARERWLTPAELEVLLLRQTTPPLPVTPTKPPRPPPSGTLLLYDRSSTSDYKDDGHAWIKKNHSKKVREDHVKLRIGGKKRVAGCYVHGLDVATFKRRAYHLLDYATGKTMVRPQMAGVKRLSGGGKKGGSGENENKEGAPSLILVHYLDTLEASRLVAREVGAPAGSAAGGGGGGGRKRRSKPDDAGDGGKRRRGDGARHHHNRRDDDDENGAGFGDEARRPTISPDPYVAGEAAERRARGLFPGNGGDAKPPAAAVPGTLGHLGNLGQLNQLFGNAAALQPNANAAQQLQNAAALLGQQQGQSALPPPNNAAFQSPNALQPNAALLPFLQQAVGGGGGLANATGLQLQQALTQLHATAAAPAVPPSLPPPATPAAAPASTTTTTALTLRHFLEGAAQAQRAQLHRRPSGTAATALSLLQQMQQVSQAPAAAALGGPLGGALPPAGAPPPPTVPAAAPLQQLLHSMASATANAPTLAPNVHAAPSAGSLVGMLSGHATTSLGNNGAAALQGLGGLLGGAAGQPTPHPQQQVLQALQSLPQQTQLDQRHVGAAPEATTRRESMRSQDFPREIITAPTIRIPNKSSSNDDGPPDDAGENAAAGGNATNKDESLDVLWKMINEDRETKADDMSLMTGSAGDNMSLLPDFGEGLDEMWNTEDIAEDIDEQITRNLEGGGGGGGGGGGESGSEGGSLVSRSRVATNDEGVGAEYCAAPAPQEGYYDDDGRAAPATTAGGEGPSERYGTAPPGAIGGDAGGRPPQSQSPSSQSSMQAQLEYIRRQQAELQRQQQLLRQQEERVRRMSEMPNPQRPEESTGDGGPQRQLYQHQPPSQGQYNKGGSHRQQYRPFHAEPQSAITPRTANVAPEANQFQPHQRPLPPSMPTNDRRATVPARTGAGSGTGEPDETVDILTRMMNEDRGGGGGDDDALSLYSMTDMSFRSTSTLGRTGLDDLWKTRSSDESASTNRFQKFAAAVDAAVASHRPSVAVGPNAHRARPSNDGYARTSAPTQPPQQLYNPVRAGQAPHPQNRGAPAQRNDGGGGAEPHRRHSQPAAPSRPQQQQHDRRNSATSQSKPTSEFDDAFAAIMGRHRR